MRRATRGLVLMVVLLIFSSKMTLHVDASTVSGNFGISINLIVTDASTVVPTPEPSRQVHTHDYVASIVVLPTCTTQGYTKYLCSCGSSYVSDIVKELGHVESGWEIILQPTTTSYGELINKCSRCGVILEKKLIPYLPVQQVIQKVNSIPDNVKEYSTSVDYREKAIRPTLVSIGIVPTVEEGLISGNKIDLNTGKLDEVSSNTISLDTVQEEQQPVVDTKIIEPTDVASSPALQWKEFVKHATPYVKIFLIILLIVAVVISTYVGYRIKLNKDK